MVCIVICIESVFALIIIEYLHNANTIHTNTDQYILNAYLLVLNTCWFVFNTYQQYIPQLWHNTYHNSCQYIVHVLAKTCKNVLVGCCDKKRNSAGQHEGDSGRSSNHESRFVEWRKRKRRVR